MASVTDNRPTDSLPPEAAPAEERYVDAQIRRTRRALKFVDFTAGVITLTIGVLAYLLVMAVTEHWVVPGGWSPLARGLLFVALIGGAAWFCWRSFWPLVSKPINPAYAAKTIEQSSPSLKNSLLNFLLLRERRRQISRQVYQAIEQQAAQRLAQVPLDTVVDRSAILKLGYVLMMVVALCALYRVLSPKDPLVSAGRLLMPWSDIAVPSRVQILDVKPGDTSAARGEQLVVTAEVLGAAEDEPVRLRYSANDEQVVDQEVFMSPQDGGLRFEGRLPGRVAMGGGGGIQNDLTYWIEAGDARSPTYKVNVFSQPTLVVEKIRYEYPMYTRYIPREVENTGDISAVEGTIVTITAVANQAIESAHVDFDADGRHDLLMKSEGANATVSFPLEFGEDRRTPRYQSYVLRYTTSDGRKNPAPPKYSIDVQQDYAPEIELLAPEQEMMDVALQDEVVIEVEARDPDFSVRNVAILGEVAGERVLKESLLSQDRTGRFTGQLKLVPQELDLKPGDVLEYWGAAADNRRPEPNLAFTRHQKLRIIGPPDLSGGEQGEQGEGQGNQGEGQQGESGGEGEEGQQGGSGQGNQQGDSQDQQGGESGQGGEGGAGEQSDTPGENSEPQSGSGGQAGESEGQSNDSAQGEAGGESPTAGDSKSQPQGNTEPSGQNEGGEPSGEGKVSPEGDDDGTAFERIAKHFEDRQPQSGEQQQPGESEGAQDGSTEQEGSSQEGQDAQGVRERESSEGGEQPGDQQGEAEGEQQSEQQGQQPGDQQGEQQGDQQGAQQGEQQEKPPGDQQGDMKGAEGGEAAPQQPDGGQEKGDQQGEKRDAGGEMEENQGSAGAGENPGENQGSPNPAGDKKPNDKPTDEASEPKQNDQEAPMEGQSKKESDSQGDQGGDRAGGGQEGGGQKADEEGTGGAGEHQAADDGGSAADEQGQGETGDKAGGDQQAAGETGQSSGDQQGQGSKQGDQAGQQPGGEQSDSAEKPPGENASDPSSAGGQPQAGGTGGSSSTPPSATETEPGDKANLDYARKQTDLVLDKLDDQLRNQQVDKDLLEKLGWTPEELRRFVERWKHLKSQAEGGGPQAEDAQQELDNALRSLGLGNRNGPSFQSQTAKDKLRDLQDAYRGHTPMEYQERMRKYVKGTATAQEE